jgi:hypothetical protein
LRGNRSRRQGGYNQEPESNRAFHRESPI